MKKVDISYSISLCVFVVLLPSSLHKEKNRFLMNIMVQVLLKQGQVEVSTTDLTADYTEAVLLHRSVLEDLNRTIRVSLYHQKQSHCKTRMYILINVHPCFLYVQIRYENVCICQMIVIYMIRHLESRR